MALGPSQVVSGTTLKLLFDRVEIGEVQDISITETYSIKPMDGLGSSNTLAFLPGVFRGEMSAKRAFLEPDMIFSLLVPFMTTKALEQSGVTNSNNINYGGIVGNVSFGETPDRILSLATSLLGVAYGDNEKPSFVVMFDIDLVSPDGTILISLQDAVIDSRKTSISIDHLIMMQDLTIKYRRRVK